MRRVLITLALCFVATSCYAEDVDMGIIKEIESSNCKFQIGDGGKALGCYQLHKGVVDDYNRAFGTKYMHKIALNEAKAKEIGNWYMNKNIDKYLKYNNIPQSNLNKIASYNWGIGNVKRWYKSGSKFEELPKQTQAYYQKYVSLLVVQK